MSHPHRLSVEDYLRPSTGRMTVDGLESPRWCDECQHEHWQPVQNESDAIQAVLGVIASMEERISALEEALAHAALWRSADGL